MRTTLTIDDDVLVAARELAEATGRPIGAALSELARRGLQATPTTGNRDGALLLPGRAERSGTLEDVNRLRDDLP